MSEQENELHFMATKDRGLSQNDKAAIEWALNELTALRGLVRDLAIRSIDGTHVVDRIAALEAENAKLKEQAALAAWKGGNDAV